MSGTTGTVRTITDLLQLFRDGQSPGSINAKDLRDLIASLNAISGVTSVAGKVGDVSLLHGDIQDFTSAVVAALTNASLPQFTSLATADQIFATSGGSGGWITFSALQTQLRGAATPQTVQASQPGTIVTSVGPVITDASGNTYGLNSGNQLVFDGQTDASTSNVTELYYGSDGQIYWENSSGLWYTRANPLQSWAPTNNPLAPPPPPPPPTFTSGNGEGITNTLGVNAVTSTSVTLLWTAPAIAPPGQLYVAQFRRWCDLTWRYSGPPFSSTVTTVTGLAPNTIYQFRVQPNGSRFCPPIFGVTSAISATSESPDGTIIADYSTSGSTQYAITDATGNRWTLVRGDDVSPYYVAVNGVTDTTTKNVTNLFYVNHLVYQTNKSQGWWYKSSPGGSWTGTTDPRTGAPPAAVLPASSTNSASPDTVMSWHGAIPLNAMQVTVIYYGPNWPLVQSPTQTQVSNALRNMVAGPYFQGLQEYGVFQAPQIVNEILVDSTPPTNPVEADHENFLTGLFNAGTLAPPSVDEHLYLIQYQNGVSVSGINGEHYSYWYNGFLVRYAIVLGWQPAAPQTALDGRMMVSAHEIAEAATDPAAFFTDNKTLTDCGWFGWIGQNGNPANSLGEIEDLNINVVTDASVGGNWLQPFYSNLAGAAIVPTAAPATIPSWPPAPPAIPISSGTPQPAGPGPAASGSLATVDFTAPTGRTAPAALWGIGAAELTNNYFAICTDTSFVNAAAAISPALLRINSNSGGSTGAWTDSIFANGVTNPNWSVLSNFMAVAYKFIQPTCRFIFGVKFYGSAMMGSPSAYATACAAMVNYFKTTKSGSVYLPVWGVEIDNETNGKVDINTYCSYFNAAATAIHNIDPTINVIGPVYSYISATSPDGNFQTLAQQCGTNIGRFCYHGYRYDHIADGATHPLDYYFQSTRPANDAQVCRQSVAGTPAANVPIFMGEYALEDDVQNLADEQGQVNAVWTAYWMLNGFLSGYGVDSGAIWELSGDTTYGVIQNGAINPTGYFLSKAGAVMGGNQVSCTFGNGAPYVSLATVNGNHFAVMLVNYSTTTGSPVTAAGSVGLSRWPINGTGNGIINRWECSNTYPNGSLSTLSVTNGVTDATTVPPQSVVILYA